MRILVANKFWYRRGGLERVMFDEIDWLEAQGHQVAHFSTSHPDNIDSPWSDGFVEYLELGGGAGGVGALRAAFRMFDNRPAAQRFAVALERFRPDVIHIHGIHRQLSPSILKVARDRGVPVVQTVHDYHHVCPADTLLRGGCVTCEPRACGRYDYLPAVINRCHRGGLATSVLSAAETCYQRVRRAYEQGVARFISPSRFLADVMSEGGWSIPTDVIPNAVPLPVLPPSSDSDTGAFVFAGRLSPEKGVEVLLEAGRRAGQEVVVAGEGPCAEDLRSVGHGRFLGRLDGTAVESLMRGARAVVVPSVWFENAPMSVLEAMAAGKAVIASRIGGIPEQIEHERDGILVDAGDAEQLASAMRRLADDPGLAARLGASARDRVSREFTPERHVRALLSAYEEVL